MSATRAQSPSMTPEQKRQLRAFHKALKEQPLEPGDPRYVPHLSMGGTDPIAELANEIAWSEDSSVNLLSGQRGSGKSTELMRLKGLLEAEGCVVFLVDMQNYLNLTTEVEISDFLISMLGAWGEQVSGNLLKEGFWERAAKFLQSEVQLDPKIQLPVAGDAKLTVGMSLKNDENFRRQIQQRSRGHVAKLVAQARDFAWEVINGLRQQHADPDLKVVLLLDSLEQVRGVGEEAGKIYASVEELFSGNSERLIFDGLHVVYTIPPYLTPLRPGIAADFGSNVVYTLPSVHVRGRSGEVDEQGIAVIEQIVSTRFADWQQVFSPEQIKHAALITGGHPRELFRLLRQSLVKAGTDPDGALPLPDTILSSSEEQLRRNLLPVPQDDAEWLNKIASSKQSCLPSAAELPRLARFFDTSLVLNYRNGEDWYDTHPLLDGHLQEQ